MLYISLTEDTYDSMLFSGADCSLESRYTGERGINQWLMIMENR